ncbi:DUF1178 family protein [Algimonas porphyrae]|uniref:DUF1178 family protein n=1 Tax=Algimonas porphyrae TaxID=1128113 RepID=A0ABQ5V3F1_9PROT|nr:DUF1178 family protein [Algimonas porphyrae]GLQ21512.1 hypothetical protein GCM10007854_24670 [Algimonas porphyrae]
MIRYALICDRDHSFEGWFGSSSDYDDQHASGLLVCPQCGSEQVDKAIMSPAVRSADRSAQIADAIRNEIAETCDDVGENFTDEARAMFYGEKPERSIYGQATAQQAKALLEDGIPAMPIPPALDPKRAKKKLN